MDEESDTTEVQKRGNREKNAKSRPIVRKIIEHIEAASDGRLQASGE